MRCLDRFNAKMKQAGGNLRSENIKSSRELLDVTFADDSSYAPGIYIWSLGKIGKEKYHNDIPIEIRLYKRTYSAANGVTVKFQTLYNTPIQVGDVIYDSEKDKYLICTEAFDLNGIHWHGKFTLCNWLRKWQNENGDILEYPCYDTNATQYNSGEQSNRQFTIGSSQHLIILPYDENTVSLNTPKRFFLDKNYNSPTSYIVTQNDTTSYNFGDKGIVRITLLESEKNSDTDRPDLGICDYKDTSSFQKDNSGGNYVLKSVIEYDTNIITSGGDEQVFVGRFYDNQKKEISNIKCKWEVVCGFLDALIIKESGNSISISIDNDDYIDEDFRLILSDMNGNNRSSIIISVESLL